jgi:hypothetical protein
MLRLYDYPKPARWIGKAELIKRWPGQAMVISRGDDTQPALDFETMLEDFGAAYPQEPRTCTFRFRNMGRETLKILDVKKSCGCAEAKLSQSELRPGDKASLTVTLDLKGRQGVQRQTVYLRTSNLAQPVIPLTSQGTVLSPIHLSTGAIDLGEVHPGQRVQYEFVVTDRNGGALQLTSCTFAAEAKASSPDALAVNASWQATDRSADECQQDCSPLPGWITIIRGKGDAYYRVTLAAQVSPQAPSGLHQGMLTLSTNDPHYPSISLPLSCQVTNGNWMMPRPISLGIVSAGRPVRRTLPLKELGLGDLDQSAGPLVVADTTGPLQPRVTLRRTAGRVEAIELELNTQNASRSLGAGFHEGAIKLKSAKGVVTIPWMCLAKES